MILDNDNISAKKVLEVPITFKMLLDLGFVIFNVDTESFTIGLTYKDCCTDFFICPVNLATMTYDEELVVWIRRFGFKVTFTNINQLMNFVHHDLGY